jgi:hypothetical protein
MGDIMPTFLLMNKFLGVSKCVKGAEWTTVRIGKCPLLNTINHWRTS